MDAIAIAMSYSIRRLAATMVGLLLLVLLLYQQRTVAATKAAENEDMVKIPVAVVTGRATQGIDAKSLHNSPPFSTTTSSLIPPLSSSSSSSLSTLSSTLSSIAVANASSEGPASPVFSPDDSDFILSVTVRIYCATDNALIYYTLDNSIPNANNPNASITHSGLAILISKVGITQMSAAAMKQGLWSPIVKKTYVIMDVCASPAFTHKSSIYGPNTFAGVGEVTATSTTAGSTIYYSFDCLAAPVNIELFPHSIMNGGTILLQNPGPVCIHAIAHKIGYADSSTSQSTYTVLAKVKTPVITPSTDEFTISATIFITSPTINSTLRYTTDGSDPNDSSMQMLSGSAIIIEELGQHTVKAFATLDKIISSDIAVKTFKVLERVGAPLVSPVGGSFVDDLKVNVFCPENVMNKIPKARVHYTTSSYLTPSINSPFVICGDPILLSAPGKFTLRVLISASDMSPSAIVQAVFSLTRPHFDEFPILKRPNVTIDCLPIVSVEIVEKDISIGGYCPNRLIRGRMIVMENPVGHFDMLDPLDGCDSGKLELPSISGRAFKAHEWLDNSSFYERYEHLTKDQWMEWDRSYKQVSELGCEIVTNAGFFNVTSGRCFGNIVSQGNVIQSGDYHNVNFGIRNGSYFIGYVNETDVLSESNPFDTMLSGITWLVRHGKSYVSESMSKSGDSENLDDWQSTGYQFPSVLSARTAIGYDKLGRLRLLQVEGETWVRGMSLYEFADFAVELGFEAAINLDGGGSATMTVNHTLVSEPSWKCLEDDGLDHLPNNFGYYRCEKPVASITCIHATPPPPLKFATTDVDDAVGHRIPSAPPSSASPSSLSPSSSSPSSLSPSRRPTFQPTTSPSKQTVSPTPPVSEFPVNNSSSNECLSLLSTARESVNFYKYLSLFLAIALLILIVAIICCSCCKSFLAQNSEMTSIEVADHDETIDDESFIANLERKNNTHGRFVAKDIEMNSISSPFSIKDSGANSPGHSNNNDNSNFDNSNRSHSDDNNEFGSSWKDKLKDMKFSLDDDDDDDNDDISEDHGNHRSGNDKGGNNMTSKNKSKNKSKSKSSIIDRIDEIDRDGGKMTQMVISPTIISHNSSSSSSSSSSSNSSSRPSRNRNKPEVHNPLARGGYSNIAAKESDDDDDDSKQYQPLKRK